MNIVTRFLVFAAWKFFSICNVVGRPSSFWATASNGWDCGNSVCLWCHRMTQRLSNTARRWKRSCHWLMTKITALPWLMTKVRVVHWLISKVTTVHWQMWKVTLFHWWMLKAVITYWLIESFCSNNHSCNAQTVVHLLVVTDKITWMIRLGVF